MRTDASSSYVCVLRPKRGALILVTVDGWCSRLLRKLRSSEAVRKAYVNDTWKKGISFNGTFVLNLGRSEAEGNESLSSSLTNSQYGSQPIS